MATTLGLHAPRLAAARALLTKSGRREQGLFLVDGPTMLDEALQAGVEPDAVYVSDASAEALSSATRRAVESRLYVVPERAIGKLSDLETPPGIVSAFATRSPAGLDGILASGGPVAVLASVSDPGNAGTLVRTAEIFGFSGVLFTPDAVEPHNPKTVRATMGAVFRVPIAVAPAEAILEAARARDYVLVAADRTGDPLPGFEFPARSLIAIGHERRGVGAAFGTWDRAVAIPHSGAGESLNAAVAGGIIFYAFSQAFRTRNAQAPGREKP